jgi:hypothetical protein
MVLAMIPKLLPTSPQGRAALLAGIGLLIVGGYENGSFLVCNLEPIRS